jgi:hypothetical protein
VEGPFEHGNQPSGSIKCLEILEAAQLATSQEGLSSMELVDSEISKRDQLTSCKMTCRQNVIASSRSP